MTRSIRIVVPRSVCTAMHPIVGFVHSLPVAVRNLRPGAGSANASATSLDTTCSVLPESSVICTTTSAIGVGVGGGATAADGVDGVAVGIGASTTCSANAESHTDTGGSDVRVEDDAKNATMAV